MSNHRLCVYTVYTYRTRETDGVVPRGYLMTNNRDCFRPTCIIRERWPFLRSTYFTWYIVHVYGRMCCQRSAHIVQNRLADRPILLLHTVRVVCPLHGMRRKNLHITCGTISHVICQFLVVYTYGPRQMCSQ